MTDRSAEECLDQAANGAKSSRCCASDRLETAREDQAECSLVSVMFAQKHARLRQSKRCAAGKTNEVLCRNRLYCASRDALVKRACKFGLGLRLDCFRMMTVLLSGGRFLFVRMQVSRVTQEEE